jgi:glycosyltransferase involved in cell wall biosynthesis
MSNKISIAFITEFAEIGGGESNLFYVAQELSKHNTVYVFCPKGKLFNMCTENGILCEPIRPLLFRRWLKGLALLTYNYKLIKKLNTFDIVHAYSLQILPSIFFVKTNIVWTNHGFFEKVQGLRGRVISFLVKYVIAVSTHTFEHLDVPETKKVMIPLGIPINKLNPSTVDKPSEKGRITICCVARFQEIKGQDILLNAIEKVCNRLPSKTVDLLFVGDVNGNDKGNVYFKERVVAISRSLSYVGNLSIRFEGYQKFVTPYYHRCTFVVIPSRYESFSMTAIEALSHGKPIIVPKIGGPKDILDSSTIGLFFTPGSVDSLADSILSMASNIHKFSADNCIKRAEAFSIANQATRFVDVYRDVIEKNTES